MTILKPNISIKNRFALLRHIGSGGFSEVWLANDLLAEKHVVLKFFATQIGMSDPGMEMFKKEFKVNDVLTDHPNVLRVNYIDELENRPFLIMPLCRDGSLGDVLLRNKESGSTMDDKTLYEALLQIARGLQHLHAHDVLHLDIKPDNVLIDGP
ncbi:MAG: protein kinase, partial [Cyclobacteriaceae bacterium]|nr:protein kinase [Cyclobacteriaceae bacterium]